MSSNATQHFVLQRFTAMIQIPLVVWLVISLLRHAGDSRADMVAWLGRPGLLGLPLTAILLGLFLVSVGYHMHLGMNDIIDDYIHKKGTRGLLHTVNILFALGMAGAGLLSIISILIV
ncbi:succinate dehydrogenase, hydrophobic membrane anchor protein [Parvularcula sp. LCG005]|uniref:succinate dehydrogenase, hydrophobic membrane anchor protein n=1 Tax=Parvularcula sp. LCG005 TaxID=3078805 RepID=UPI00294215A1|nr:succinate dehydrogenase, hydrophobic membrane anchor protein [Parvularcula sp. LCG005]WOI53199.1 succinate dehydrogenase, hydrophobic membrane anchor protein [Parvularcula sp. LCG005]